MIRRFLYCLLFALLFVSCQQDPLPQNGLAEATSENAETPLEVQELDAPFGENTEFIIYYNHRRYDGLIPVRVNLLQAHTLEARVKQVVDLLTIQPSDPDAETLWPPSTHIREVYIQDGGNVIIDFHGGFIAKFAAGSPYEEYMVYSLVNSILTNFEELKTVFLLIDGAKSETLLGSIDIETPLTFRDRILTVIPEDFDPDSQIIVESLMPEEDEG
jgi:hypothetical protein